MIINLIAFQIGWFSLHIRQRIQSPMAWRVSDIVRSANECSKFKRPNPSSTFPNSDDDDWALF
jgi:hypothetical protein